VTLELTQESEERRCKVRLGFLHFLSPAGISAIAGQAYCVGGPNINAVPRSKPYYFFN
jgi:hypothetical protein